MFCFAFLTDLCSNCIYFEIGIISKNILKMIFTALRLFLLIRILDFLVWMGD